jgi:hypothetical protein
MDTENGFTDINKTCRDCGAVFALTAGEQAFYSDPTRGLDPPTRCKACRARRRAMRATDQAPPYGADRAQPPFRTW